METETAKRVRKTCFICGQEFIAEIPEDEEPPKPEDMFFCMQCTQLNAKGLFVKCTLCKKTTWVDGWVKDRLLFIEQLIRHGWITYENDVKFTGAGTIVLSDGCPQCTKKPGSGGGDN